jgi:hypothetical protein
MRPDALDQEHLARLAAIGRALGQDTPYEERHGERRVAARLALIDEGEWCYFFAKHNNIRSLEDKSPRLPLGAASGGLARTQVAVRAVAGP